jgi:hypothetical protein
MRDMKQIEINIDETQQLERIKKSLQRFKEETKEREHRLDALITPVIQTIGFLLILTGVYSLIINNL